MENASATKTKVCNSLHEPHHEKTNNLVSEQVRTGPTQTKLYKHRRWLEAENFGFEK